MTRVLRYSSVSKDFKTSKTLKNIKALSSVSLDVHQGEIVGLVGADGAGKTTLIRLAMGIIEPSEGAVELLGSADRRSAREKAGYVPQRFSLYQDMTVIENIHFFGSLYGAAFHDIEAKAKEILTRTDLWQFKDRLAGALSGGMKQKLALAAGLMHTPQILFLDEPTTGVDPVARREFWSMIYELNRAGITIVVSTPYMDEAELCTRIAFVHKGVILDTGSSSELLARYRHRVFEADTPLREAKGLLTACPSVTEANLFGTSYHVETGSDKDGEAMKKLVSDCLSPLGDIAVREITPSLEDLFVSFAKEMLDE